MPFHISTAGASLNNATYTSHKRTVHIPGSHALPPGVSTTMAWELGYARKRFEADTRGIENTVNPDVYRLQEGRFVVREDAKVKHDEALLMAEELRDSVRTVERGERVRFEDMGAVSGDVKGLDHLNPYFMHLEMLKKKYTPKELVTWSYSGRGVRDKRVPVGGWPSGVEFEMGVKYMPEISDTVFVMKPVGHTDDNGASQDEKNEEGRREDEEEEEDKDKQEVRPLSAPLPGETKNEHLLREILSIQNDKSIAASEVLTASTKATIPESSTTEKESRQSEHKEPQSQDPQRVFPQQYPQPNYFPLPAVPSIPAINPAHLPLAYAYNRRYHSTPIHPDFLIDPETGLPLPTTRSSLQIPAKYLATYNTAALVNSRPLATALPSPSPTTSSPSLTSNHANNRLPPAYNAQTHIPQTTSAIAAASGLGALSLHESRLVFGRGRVQNERVAQQIAYSRYPVPPALPSPRETAIPPLAPVLNGRVPLPAVEEGGKGGLGAGGVSEDGKHPWYHGIEGSLDPVEAERRWLELVEMQRPRGRRGWNYVGRDHMGHFHGGLAPVTNYMSR